MRGVVRAGAWLLLGLLALLVLVVVVELLVGKFHPLTP